MVVVGPRCDPAVGKDEYRKLCLSTLHKGFLLLQFVNSHPVKERVYGSWGDRASRPKRKSISSEERVNWHRTWISSLVFCFRSNMFVHWFSFPRVTSSIRPFFGSHPQNGSPKFSSPYIFVASVQLGVFTLSRLPANPPKPTRPPSCTRYRGEDHICLQRLYTRAEDLGPPAFLLSSPTNAVTYQRLSDPRVPWYTYLPTPPVGQDMTQGHFLKRGLTGLWNAISLV